jgi:hypothetical protein
LVFAVTVTAQDESETEYITHGEFAALLMKFGAFQTDIPAPEQALIEVKRLGLIPSDWETDDFLTHGAFADVVQPLGMVYVPTDRDELATRIFVEAFLRREVWKLRDYLIAVLGGDNPVTSPSEFNP